MSRNALRGKVAACEIGVTSAKRALEADWRQAKAAGRDALTPDRIVVGGLLLGLVGGRLRPLGRVAGGARLFKTFMPTLMKLATSAFSAVAAARTASAAQEAEEAADDAQDDAGDGFDGTPAGYAPPAGVTPPPPAAAAPAPPADVVVEDPPGRASAHS